MLKTDQTKLIRTGGLRAGATSRTYGVRSTRFIPTPDKIVPNFETLGHEPFGEEQLHALAQRLQMPDWPKGTLNIYGLEGLITALLVLPLSIRPTVWLPLVWNETGWKIPVALQSDDDFQEFIELLAGFMRAVDADLRATPSRSTSISETVAPAHRPSTLNLKRDWAQGFGLAISQSNYLTLPIDTISQRALYTIAIHAKPHIANSQYPNHSSDRSFRQAVLTLGSIRTSRGPLGSL